MATILCEWLNDDFHLSRSVEPEQFEDSFKSGYLLAELLNQIGIIEDLKHYQNSNNLDSSIHNYSLLEPVLRDVGLTLTSSMAFDLITAKKGVAFKLLYNLRVQLANQKNVAAKKSSNFDAAFLMNQHSLYTENKKKFFANEHQYFTEHLKLKLAKTQLPKKKTVVDEYIEKLQGKPKPEPKPQTKPSVDLPFIDYNVQEIETDEQLYIRQLPQPQNPSHLAEAQAKIMKLKLEARKNDAETKILSNLKEFTADTSQFEKKMKLDREESFMEIKMSNRQFTPASVRLSSASTQLSSRLTTPSYAEKNHKYLEKIRAKREEEEWLRHERTQRRSRLLQVHAKINQDFEKNQYEKILVEKLSKQSKQERRIAEQLLMAKQEKEVMKKNRLELDTMHAQRRQREYEQALDREGELAKTLRLEYHNQLNQFLDAYKEVVAQYQAKKKERESASCKLITKDIIDVAVKIATVKEMNDSVVPSKMVNELKSLFKAAAPIDEYPVPLEQDKIGYHKLEFGEADKVAQQDNAELLDFTELRNYLQMKTPWKMDFNLKNNLQLGKMVEILFKMIEEAEKISPLVKLSPEPLKVVLLGKRFAGKRSLAKLISKACKIVTIDSDSVVKDALAAFKQMQAGTRPADDPKAQLGSKIRDETLKNGTIDDSIINELFCLTVSELEQDPTKPGWVLIDFPKTKAQAQMLDKALSGYEEAKSAKPGSLKKAAKEPPKSAGARKQSMLAPGTDRTNGTEMAFSVIDAVISLEVSNDTAFKRCSGRRLDPMDGTVYHIESNPPPNVPGLAERLVPLDDPISIQLHQHLAAFEQNYEPLKSWYEKFGNFQILDGNQTSTDVTHAAQELLQKIIEKKRKDRELEVVAENEKKEEVNGNAQPEHPFSEILQRETLPSNAKTPTKHFTRMLHDKWVEIETNFSDAMRFAFRSLRRERDTTMQHFYEKLQNIKQLLKLPDGRQSLITAFRDDYNAQDEDFLLDADVKAEFHARADELRDKLWDKIDARRDEIELERTNYIDSRWVEDHAIIITNVFVSMMQLELDRYTTTKQFICDFTRDSVDQIIEPSSKVATGLPKLEGDAAIPAFFEDLKKMKKDLFSRKRRGSNGNLKKAAAGKKGAEDAAKQAEFTIESSIFSQALDTAVGAAEKQMTDDDLKDLKKVELTDVQKAVLNDAIEALTTENTLLRSRLAQLKHHALEHLNELVQKGRDTYNNMFEMIGTKYQQDNDAVKLLVLFIKERIESELKLEEVQFEANVFWIPEADYTTLMNGISLNNN